MFISYSCQQWTMMTRQAESSNETVWLISECQINSAGSLPEQNTKLHGAINRRVDLILWLEQCSETIEKMARAWKGRKKIYSIMNYLSFKTNLVLQQEIKAVRKSWQLCQKEKQYIRKMIVGQMTNIHLSLGNLQIQPLRLKSKVLVWRIQ